MGLAFGDRSSGQKFPAREDRARNPWLNASPHSMFPRTSSRAATFAATAHRWIEFDIGPTQSNQPVLQDSVAIRSGDQKLLAAGPLATLNCHHPDAAPQSIQKPQRIVLVQRTNYLAEYNRIVCFSFEVYYSEMEHTLNNFGQRIGWPLPDWVPPPIPPRETMPGRYCRLEVLDIDRHAAGLFEADAAEEDGRSWTYLAYGPFSDFQSYRAWLSAYCLGNDPLFVAIIDTVDDQPAGLASYLRIAPAAGSVEVGHIHYAPRMLRSPAATEAMYLMMKWAFESGYRRYEWKCDALNAASRAAAQRLGFSFEGIFRQATVYKARNRDTAWYATIDTEWPALRQAFLEWLAPANFDSTGQQRTRLSDLTKPILKVRG